MKCIKVPNIGTSLCRLFGIGNRLWAGRSRVWIAGVARDCYFHQKV